MRDHRSIEELLPAYVLDALTGEDLECVRAHLSACGDCREEVDRLRAATDALLADVPRHDPPPDLRDRVIDSLDAIPRTDADDTTYFATAIAAVRSGWRALPAFVAY